MNPPTDASKKDLPLALRCRFTEIYVDELSDKADLRAVATRYLATEDATAGDDSTQRTATCVDFYLWCKRPKFSAHNCN